MTPVIQKKISIMIVAGEASGDAHASRLVNALRNAPVDADLEFFGCAGPKMREAGVEAIVNADDLAVVGVAEIARVLPMFLSALDRLKAVAAERRPDAVVLVDFPDFNLKLVKSLKKQGLKTVYFISPQLWAWRKYRVRTIRKYVDLLLTILPFENEWYEKNGFTRTAFVGHPLTNNVNPRLSRAEFCAVTGLDSDRPIVSLLPGSRHHEIIRTLPVMLDAALIIEKKLADVQFLIAVRSGKNRSDVDAIIAMRKALAGSLTVIEDSTYDALAASDATVVTSGTATLETGIIGTPMVIVYKGSALNYLLLKPLINIEHFGLVNLIAGRKVAKELLQYDVTAENVSNEILRLLDPETNNVVRRELRDVLYKLGDGNASEKAAEALLGFLAES